MDVATLGLRVDNSGAARNIDDTANKLDNLGAKGEAAAAKLERVGQAAGRAAVGHDALAGATAASTRGMTAMNALTAEASSRMGEHSLQIGRVERSMEGLAARMLGVNDTLALSATALAKFGLGEITSLGILAGIVAIGFAWQALGNRADELGKKIEDAMKKMHEGTIEAQIALGDLQLGRATTDVAAAKAALATAEKGTVDASRSMAGSGGAAPVASVNATDVAKARKALADADAELFEAQQNKSQIQYQMRGDAEKDAADNLALLVKSNNATHAERQRALTLYKSDLAEIVQLGKSQTDNVRRAQLIQQSTTLKEALFPTEHSGGTATELATANMQLGVAGGIGSALSLESQLSGESGGTQQVVAARARQIVELQKAIAEQVKQQTADVNGLEIGPNTKELSKSLWGSVDTRMFSGEAVKKGALSEIQGTPDAFGNAVDRAKVLGAIDEADNAKRTANGKPAKGPSDQYKEAQREVANYAAAAIAAIHATNASWETQSALIDEVIKKEREAGLSVKSDSSSTLDKLTSGLRTGADAANLFGGARGSQYANILNTAANAATNVSAAVAAGGANPIADAQAALSVASLGKQILGLGGLSHDAARAIAEASESIKVMIATLNASVNHDALGGLLAQAQAADDARKSQINSDLSGKKKEAERNAALAQDDALFAKQKTQIAQQYQIQQQFDKQSLTARLDRAKGLSYQADLEDLAVKQQEEMNAAILAGRDAAYLASLAQVQLAEKTNLANSAITQLANSPTGFFAERYFGQFSTPAAFPGITPPTASGTTGGSATFNAPVNININGADKDPLTIAKETVGELRKLGPQYGGMGTTIAETMELMS